ncbi:MAG: modification methylase [Bacteroidetes bacterium GWC2_33_15]|nr:MAG: modification methylase [Bacteroidetes bacterium GWA2_33_15]OFX50209.1 MAG: modification methylase [Bacteroidetes bacterium GWC2_33_15]OFX65361.1 MAG: modification methylase [Bacteroidetes bacterium GWB2_32_14]OFX70588.1 MAG: modification methylase [Bacteroidetes bacterium GWD2_33_33]HAN19535.1 modification methylase [Bacteroidales bacterium]
MAKNKFVAPFLKWVGGKRQIMPSIVSVLPKNIQNYTYIEPFVGGGAVLFHLTPSNAVINDFNSELINVYEVIRNNLDELIIDLKKHKNESDYFYKIRGIDRTKEFEKLSKVQRASRIIYLNKTCFNGLYRVNNAGEFNAPFGRYKNPNIVNEPTLKAVSKYLNTNNIQILNGDYKAALKQADKNSFVYLDPPYHPISENSNFTGYIRGGWDMQDQIKLREACDDLTKKGIKFLLSNSSAPLIKDQYKKYNIQTIKANRAINSNGSNRGEIEEVLIRNYE